MRCPLSRKVTVCDITIRVQCDVGIELVVTPGSEAPVLDLHQCRGRLPAKALFYDIFIVDVLTSEDRDRIFFTPQNFFSIRGDCPGSRPFLRIRARHLSIELLRSPVLNLNTFLARKHHGQTDGQNSKS